MQPSRPLLRAALALCLTLLCACGASGTASSTPTSSPAPIAQKPASSQAQPAPPKAPDSLSEKLLTTLDEEYRALPTPDAGTAGYVEPAFLGRYFYMIDFDEAGEPIRASALLSQEDGEGDFYYWYYLEGALFLTYSQPTPSGERAFFNVLYLQETFYDAETGARVSDEHAAYLSTFPTILAYVEEEIPAARDRRRPFDA